MKTKDIAAQYDLDQEELDKFIRKHPEIKRIIGSMALAIPDADVPQVVNRFKSETNWISRAERERKMQDQQRKMQDQQQAIASILITSGFNFDGYTITKYSGYISGDDATQIPRTGLLEFSSKNGQKLTDALVKIRLQALKELKMAAYDLGCNAVIGVDFDYITLEPETANLGRTVYEPYVICVTANGNAVVIEKN
ncbi:MAG: heavy metal-binding domain-containing protein [Firmicutes bacterium]|nr:heavy metal-binding domain-containing protein [Bacillota bacterium]